MALCDALSAVHHAGLLHRDIKAGNAMRAEDWRILLMDFGLSHALHQETRGGAALHASMKSIINRCARMVTSLAPVHEPNRKGEACIRR